MWRPAYLKAGRDQVPGAEAKRGFDRFPIMRHVVETVDKVRSAEHKALRKTGNDRRSRSKSRWLTNPETMPKKARARLEEPQSAELKTGWAWALKEVLRAMEVHRGHGLARCRRGCGARPVCERPVR